ncbi:DDE superfamily endonuclease [Hirsutella rhossiliensis]
MARGKMDPLSTLSDVSKDESQSGGSKDDVYPIHLLDGADSYRKLHMSYLFRFNDILDAQRLADSLSRLLNKGDWRKLGGRLRLKDDGNLEIHVPRSFSSERPAIAFTRDVIDDNIETHPLGARLPKLSDGGSLSVQKIGSDLRPLAGSQNLPITIEEVIERDAPQISLHITSFNDATVVALCWPHVLMDVMGLRALLRNWSLILNGNEDGISSIIGTRDDVQIRACVEALMKQLNNERTVGRNWVSKFINRHPDIKNKRGRRQEANRFNAFTPRAVHWFFDIREKEYGWIKPENTVNVDEGGIMSGFGLDSLVGKELQKQWFLTEFGKIADWHYITSPNGWTDNHIAIEWLERMDMEVMQRMHGWPHAFEQPTESRS